MALEELSLLEQLLVVASTEKEGQVNKDNANNQLNEDEFFLSKIAASDLKAFEKPSSVNLCSKRVVKSSSRSVKKLSLIHTGDTDSSDDESNRDYQNKKYNESGQEIKHLLPEATSSASEFVQVVRKTWKPNKDIPLASKKSSSSFFGADAQNTINKIPDFFGIRITNPLISSSALQDRMINRSLVTMAQMKLFVKTVSTDQDWVVAGCVVQKSAVRTSQNGYQYMIWTLSDLQNDLRTVSMFLFRMAYKQLWKTVVGQVVGVLNPSVMDHKDGSRHEATLSIDNHQRVMLLGQAKDFGYCKSKKKDGENCTAFVNTNRCTYCIYHVKQEYQKCSIRSELQSKFSGGGLNKLRNKVLGKNEVFYAGKSYTATKSKKLMAKDNKLLSFLNSKDGINTSPSFNKQKKGVATSLEISRAQRVKDIQMLKKLNGSGDLLSGLETKKIFNKGEVSSEVTLEDSRKTALDVIAKLKEKTSKLSDNIPVEVDSPKLKLLKNLRSNPAPKLSTTQNSLIDLNSPIRNRSKIKALQWVQHNGPIDKNNPTNAKNSGVKRFLESNEVTLAKKTKLDSEKIQFSDRFKKIMAQTSAHADLLEQRDLDEQDKYFNKLEVRERMEEKMMSTYKIQCKAVRCLDCKYTSFSAAQKCKDAKHKFKVFDAIKRFFKCGNCGNRTVSLEICPLLSCKNCGSTKWEKTTMMKEKIAKIGDGLSIRGGEQTFLHSDVMDANINLLVPDS